MELEEDLVDPRYKFLPSQFAIWDLVGDLEKGHSRGIRGGELADDRGDYYDWSRGN